MLRQPKIAAGLTAKAMRHCHQSFQGFEVDFFAES
jgi:hypothetical protein